MTRVEKIEAQLKQALDPTKLEIYDDSASHAGHAGARESGGGHFYATIVAEAFTGKSLVQRHQIVYQALGDLMKTDIHAFSMKVYNPNEYEENGAHQ